MKQPTVLEYQRVLAKIQQLEEELVAAAKGKLNQLGRFSALSREFNKSNEMHEMAVGMQISLQREIKQTKEQLEDFESIVDDRNIQIRELKLELTASNNCIQEVLNTNKEQLTEIERLKKFSKPSIKG